MLSKTFLLAYVNHLEMADYLAFTWVMVLSFLFLMLGIMLLKRLTFLSVGLMLIAFMGIFVAPFGIKWYFNDNLRKTQTTIKTTKQLQFSDTFILQGEVKNVSKKPFKLCLVDIRFCKYSKKGLKNYIYKLKPFKKKLLKINKTLDVNKSVDFKIVLNEFRLPNDVNITAVSECYR